LRKVLTDVSGEQTLQLKPDLEATVGDLARRDFGDAGFDVALEAEEIGFSSPPPLP
jgi:hypothetical protein